MNALINIFDMQSHRQVVLGTLFSSLFLAIITGVLISYVWFGLFPGAVYPTVYEVQIVTFFLTLMISSPVLYGMFFMSLRVSRKNHELFQLANLDPLTGIYNRRALADRFAMLSRKARRNHETGILLVIDVDNFKAINDKYGHEIGDHVLIHLAENLRAQAGNEFCFARLGGEEFAVARFGIEETAAFAFADKIRTGIENAPLKSESYDISFTVSIGYALISEDASLNAVLRNADSALYTAKRTGRNRTICYERNTAAIAPEESDFTHVVEKMPSNHLASSN